jgi:hypothetical protein
MNMFGVPKYTVNKLRCEGKVIGGFEVDLWEIRVAGYSTRR